MIKSQLIIMSKLGHVKHLHMPGVIKEQMMHHKCTSRGIIIILWEFWSKEVEQKVAAGTNKPEHKTTALYCFFHFHHKK
jgi:hypothetical protein